MNLFDRKTEVLKTDGLRTGVFSICEILLHKIGLLVSMYLLDQCSPYGTTIANVQ